MWYKFAQEIINEPLNTIEENKQNPEDFANYLANKYNAAIRLYLTNRNDLKLDHLVVPKELRKQGIGSSIMREIIDYADKNQYRLILTTASKDQYFGTTSSGRLKKFYKQFGLKENKGKDYSISENMFRLPAKCK